MTSQHFALNRQPAMPAGISNSAGVLLKSVVFSQNQVLPDLPEADGQSTMEDVVCQENGTNGAISPFLMIMLMTNDR